MGKVKTLPKDQSANPLQDSLIDKCAEICARPWKRLNVNGFEIDPNSHEPLAAQVSQRDLFSYINDIMKMRAGKIISDNMVNVLGVKATDTINIIIMKNNLKAERVYALSMVSPKLVELAFSSNPNGETIKQVSNVIGKQAADLFLSFMKDLK